MKKKKNMKKKKKKGVDVVRTRFDPFFSLFLSFLLKKHKR